MAETPRGEPRDAGAPVEEYRQLHTRLTEQVLDRAAADPQWRIQYLEDPQTATANFPETQRLQQIADEQQVPQTEENQQLIRTLNEMVLDKAQSDPQWKQLLVAAPEAAMQELFEEGAEVIGQGFTLGEGTTLRSTYYNVWIPSDPIRGIPGDPV